MKVGQMKLDTIHHIAIIGQDRDAMLHFYVDQLGFAIVSSMTVPNAEICDQSPSGPADLNSLSNRQPQNIQFPLPGMRDRHLAFKVDDVETYLAKLDQLGIEYRPSP